MLKPDVLFYLISDVKDGNNIQQAHRKTQTLVLHFLQVLFGHEGPNRLHWH